SRHGVAEDVRMIAAYQQQVTAALGQIGWKFVLGILPAYGARCTFGHRGVMSGPAIAGALEQGGDVIVVQPRAVHVALRFFQIVPTDPDCFAHRRTFYSRAASFIGPIISNARGSWDCRFRRAGLVFP